MTERATRIKAAARPAHWERGAGDTRLVNSATHAKALITRDTAPVQMSNGRVLYHTGQKWISGGSRVVLLGANGTGKTRLVHMALTTPPTVDQYNVRQAWLWVILISI